MFKNAELRLAAYNVAVFAAVLIVFSGIIYSQVAAGLDADMRADLIHMVDGVVSSIDYDVSGVLRPSTPEPDVIASVLPADVSQSLMNMRLQWFDRTGKLALEKGSFEVMLPLDKTARFQYQQNPRALLLTKAVVVDGKLLGYVRVAQPMDEADRAMQHLEMGLIFGILAATAASGVGIAILIRKSMQPLYKNIQQLKQFTADASHELRTPVTAIHTNSSVALKYPDGMRDGDREKFEMILSASKQMGRLVDDLLTLEGANKLLEGGSQQAQEIGEVLDEVRQLLSWMESSKKIAIDWNVESGLYAKGAPEDLQHIFLNVYENALRYTPQEGRVSVKAWGERNQVMIKVTDSGIGISSEDLPKVFDRFWRADKARNEFNSGNGLGLAIAKTIAERLSGSLEAESETGKGATFTLMLPQAK